MRRDYLYLIEPRATLRDQLGEIKDKAFVEFICEPTLFSNHEGGCRDAWKREDRLVQVKLLFLGSLRDFEPFQSTDDFRRVFGSEAISVTLFDTFWTIRPLSHYDELESDDCKPRLQRLLSQVERTGNKLVDNWLEWLAGHSQPDEPEKPQRERT